MKIIYNLFQISVPKRKCIYIKTSTYSSNYFDINPDNEISNLSKTSLENFEM